MLPAPFRGVLDANVLYPFTLRDTLLRAAAAGLFQLKWTEQILDEAMRNLVGDEVITEEQASRLRAAMSRAFPEAFVTDYEALVVGLTNDEKDRHVVAAAIRAGAQVIVTSNLADFRPLPEGIEAQHPDEFLCNLFDLQPDLMKQLVVEQAAALRNPPRRFEEVVAALARLVPDFAKAVRVQRG